MTGNLNGRSLRKNSQRSTRIRFLEKFNIQPKIILSTPNTLVHLAQFSSPDSLLGVAGKLKSIGDGGGAGVSFAPEVRDDADEALKAALTSWPRVEFVRRERRRRGWRGVDMAADDDGIVVVRCVGLCKIAVCGDILEGLVCG